LAERQKQSTGNSLFQQENEYLKSALAHTESLQHSLYTEMVSRIPQQDMSVPYIRNGFYYYTRFEPNKEYPIYARKIDTADAKEEILINCNINAAKHDYFSIGSIAIDSSNSIMAYSEDTLSRRIYIIRFKDLQSDLMLPDVLENTSGSMVWYNDGKAILYIVKDPNTLRSFKIFRHIIGQDQSEDTLIYEEKDDTYSVSLHKSRSGRFIYLNSSSTLTSEVLLCDADNSNAEFQVFEPRKKDIFIMSLMMDNIFILFPMKMPKTSNFSQRNYPTQKEAIGSKKYLTVSTF
jgi:oligopeptidase B